MEEALWPQWNIPPWLIAPKKKAWFYERLFFKVIIVVVKDTKRQYKRYNVNTLVYALHEVDKSDVTVVFKGFGLVCIFFVLFCFLFTIIFNW